MSTSGQDGPPLPPADPWRAAPGAADPWNTLQWRPGSPRPHVESLFLKLYVPDRRQALWLQFGARTFTAGGRPPRAHVMAGRFDAGQPARNVAVKRRFAPEEVAAAHDTLDVRLGGCLLTEGHTAGAVEGDGHRLTWDLRFAPARDPLYHLPWPVLYRLPLPKTKAVSPAADARFDGWFEVDGDRVEVRHAPGMQGHNWGSEHAWQWAWVHANHLTGAHPEAARALFEGLAARVRVGPLRSPWLTMVTLRYGQLVLRFDTLRQPLSVHSRVAAHGWEFSAAAGRHRLRGVARAEPDRFVGVHYPNPDGRLTHCANATCAALELQIEERVRGRWQTLDVLRTAESAALELAGPSLPPGVALAVPA